MGKQLWGNGKCADCAVRSAQSAVRSALSFYAWEKSVGSDTIYCSADSALCAHAAPGKPIACAWYEYA